MAQAPVDGQPKGVPFSFWREVALPVGVTVVGGVIAWEVVQVWRGYRARRSELEELEEPEE